MVWKVGLVIDYHFGGWALVFFVVEMGFMGVGFRDWFCLDCEGKWIDAFPVC